MSKFTSTNRINTRWRGNDFVGAPGSSHTFPNELHDEFLVDWAYQIQIGDITITETPTTGNIQMSTLTVGDIVVTGTATGNFGSQATVVQGTAPISISTTSNTSTVSLNASYSTSTHLHDADYVNVTGDTMSGNLYVSSATTTTTVGFGDIHVAKGTAYGTFTVNAPTDGIHIRSKNGVELLEQTGPNPVSLRTKSIGLNSSTTLPTLVDNGITFGDDVNLYRSAANALKTDDALEVVGSLTNGGTSVSLSTHTHAYQPAGTYVTSVNGTAPIVASTTTAGIVTVALTASYDPAGTAASAVSTHAAVTTSVHGITNTANLLTTSTTFANITNPTSTATTISSTTSSAPTDISGMTFTFTPTYDEDVFVQANLIFTQTVAPTATVDIISRFIVNGTITSPQGGFLRLTSGNSSPTGFTNSMAHTFTVASGVATTVKVAAYKSIANGTFGTSNISTFSILRVRA